MNVKTIIAKYMAEVGRRGGSVSTPAKASAVRENGKLGGPSVEEGG